ncbi:MAG TPA: hypothetical protein VHU18_03485 [Rhizomicrobium sp.]|jgi:hypothetical protein|nr:hypothetical protein [Rhizomicrobium sp.]
MRLRSIIAGLFGLGLSCLAIPASATLLFSGGEDVDFICNPSGICFMANFNQSNRPAWSRGAYAVNATTTDPPSNRFATPSFTASATLWIHAQFCEGFSNNCSTTSVLNDQMLRVLDTLGNATLIIRGNGTSGQVKISSRTASGQFSELISACSPVLSASLVQLDFFINYGNPGEVALYVNGVQVCDVSGINVTNGDGATTLNQVEFASPSSQSNWSEVIVATTDTRAMSRFTANTKGDGTNVGFTGTNICSSIWNTLSANDANYGYTGTSNVVHECTINNSIPPGIYSVQGLGMSARALVGATGPQHFDFVTRVGGTDYLSPNYSPTTSFSNFTNYIQTTNPATLAPWSVPDFQDPSFNVGEKSKP